MKTFLKQPSFFSQVRPSASWYANFSIGFIPVKHRRSAALVRISRNGGGSFKQRVTVFKTHARKGIR